MGDVKGLLAGVPSRRRFLAGMGATAFGLAAGCGDDGGSGAVGSSTTSTGPLTTVHTARLPSDPFTLGVASGDPLPDGVVLWTRLAPDPVAADGLGAMPADPVDVIWEVAADDRFSSLVASGVVTAEPDHAHSVHVDVEGLDPATDYHYRFRVGEFTSQPGRTRTLPSDRPDRIGIAVANCQWFEFGAFGAYRHMLDDDIDLVLHLGDYIYEYPGTAGGPGRTTYPDRFLATVADYRLRYASYRLDADLRAAHARFPFVATWDDHEVANNYAGDTVPADLDEAAVRDLRSAAYQAWWENLPVRLAPPQEGSLDVHRDLTIADLARVYVLDQRQFADEPPCRDGGAVDDFGDCDDRTDPDRTLLGEAQEQWFADASAVGGVTWNVIGNPVCLAGIDAGTDAPAFYLELWDGYPAAQQRFIEQLAGLDNPVVLTGDYHQGMVLDVHQVPFDEASPVVAPELMAPPISSPLFSDDVSRRTPHLRQQVDRHGYLSVSIEPEHVTARFQVLDDVNDAASAVTTAATWQVDAGDPVARPA